MTALTDAWQAALAAQQQAVFGYGVLGPHLAGADKPRALAAQMSHEATRDSISDAMARSGITPGKAPADYPSLYPVNDSAAALKLAARLEDDCATAWRVLYATAATDSSHSTADALARRREAQAGLSAAAVAAARWRKIDKVVPASRAFPGL